MDDKFEKKLKEFLPYIIIIGVVYLFFPAILVFTKSTGILNPIIYFGVFPVTAFLCNLYYGYKKKNDLLLSLVAPVIYIPSMLLYGNLRDSVLNCVILLVSYFICGYIGLSIGEMMRGSSKNNEEKRPSRKRVPTVVNTASAKETEDSFVIDEIEMPQSFEEVETQQSYDDYQPDYTEDDIDAILRELHDRRD